MKLSEFYIVEDELSIEQAEKLVDKYKYALSSARDVTKAIKYENGHMDIIGQLSSLAEENGLELDDYQQRAVYQAHSQLESAVYELEEVFEDALRDAQNKLDDLEYERDYGSN